MPLIVSEMKSVLDFSVILLVFLILKDVESKGITSLDSLTFDKLLSKFKVSIVKFNAAYPYGHKHDVYQKFAESTYTVNDLLVGEVAVKDYGDKENEELIKRFNVKTDDFPVVKLFIQGVAEPYDFDAKEDDQFTYQSLYDFIKSKKTGLYLGCAGCLEDFDKLAEAFMQTSDVQERKKKLRLAEDLWDKITSLTEQKSAEIYVKSMRKVIEKNDDFVPKELERVEKLMKGKITKEKQDELQKRINILQSFKIVHDEL